MTRKIHRPILVNALQMSKEHPDSFDYPSDTELNHLGKGDLVKVSDHQERFWVQVESRSQNIVRGRVDNYVMFNEFTYGDKIEFHTDNIYQIYKP